MFCRWPSILDSFFFPKTMLPNSFAIVGLSVGKSKEKAIKLFSDIPIPALTLQYLFPRDGMTDIPFSVGDLDYGFKSPGPGFKTPLISNFPLSVHCGATSGSVFDFKNKVGSVPSSLMAEAEIFNFDDYSRIDAISNITTDLYTKIISPDAWFLIRILRYHKGYITLLELIENLELGSFAITDAAWVEESFSNWQLPLKRFFGIGSDEDGGGLEAGFRDFVLFYLRQSRAQLDPEMRRELEAGDR
jgi:hypothetical protein